MSAANRLRELPAQLLIAEIADPSAVGDEEKALAAGHGLLRMAKSLPGVKIKLQVSGYDQDPRPLWQVPEVAEHVRRVAWAAMMQFWDDPMVARLTPGSLVLLVLCGTFGTDHPYIVRMVTNEEAPL